MNDDDTPIEANSLTVEIREQILNTKSILTFFLTRICLSSEIRNDQENANKFLKRFLVDFLLYLTWDICLDYAKFPNIALLFLVISIYDLSFSVASFLPMFWLGSFEN